MVSSPQHKLAQSPNLQPQHTSSVTDAGALDQARYAAMFKQLDAEALYTLLAALLITLVFWLAIYLTHESSVSFWHMPLWFVLSCLGGYVLSVVVVVVLVNCFLKDMPLHLPRCAKAKDADASGKATSAATGLNHDTTATAQAQAQAQAQVQAVNAASASSKQES